MTPRAPRTQGFYEVLQTCSFSPDSSRFKPLDFFSDHLTKVSSRFFSGSNQHVWVSSQGFDSQSILVIRSMESMVGREVDDTEITFHFAKHQSRSKYGPMALEI